MEIEKRIAGRRYRLQMRDSAQKPPCAGCIAEHDKKLCLRLADECSGTNGYQIWRDVGAVNGRELQAENTLIQH